MQAMLGNTLRKHLGAPKCSSHHKHIFQPHCAGFLRATEQLVPAASLPHFVL